MLDLERTCLLPRPNGAAFLVTRIAVLPCSPRNYQKYNTTKLNAVVYSNMFLYHNTLHFFYHVLTKFGHSLWLRRAAAA